MNTELATFAGGCFWCIEAAFNRLNGVHNAVSGYMDGHSPNPTYADICTGQTGHAEVVQLQYDPAIISYAQLLEVFFYLHDPTQLNRQGNDIGTQYRSAIFYHQPPQQQQAETFCQQLQQSGAYDEPIVTTISAASQFYPAETYHQGYAAQNPQQPYCRLLIAPKMAAFSRQFAELLRS